MLPNSKTPFASPAYQYALRTSPFLPSSISSLATVYNALPLLHCRPGFRLVAYDWMHHDLVRILLVVCIVSHAPIVANSIGEDLAIAIESRGRNGTWSLGVALEPVLRIFVPEVERTIGPGGAKGAMYGVE